MTNRLTFSDITDWAERISSLGAPDREGLVVLPTTEGRFTVHYNELCVIDDNKHRRTVVDKGCAAMTALYKFLVANKVPFSMYLHGTQPRFIVNGAPGDVPEMKRVRYFYALHLEAVIKHHTVKLSEDFMSRITDDGR